MAITAGSRIFVDTNILVYANLAQSPFHDEAVTHLRKLEKTDMDLCISRQVLREYLAVMTRPGVLTEEIPISSLVQDVRGFEAGLIVVDDGPAVTTRLLETIEQYSVAGKQIHDANIVATMLVHEIPALLTHNTADFKRYREIITVIPLVPPSE
jgi:predicted nucleic acid-binding protein